MLDITEHFNTAGQVIFKHKGITVARTKIFTMDLEFTKEATAEERKMVGFQFSAWFPGQVMKLGDKEVLIGPVREYTHEVTMYAVGNPDFSQYAPIGPKVRVRIVGIEEASPIVMRYQQEYDMGGGNCGKEHGVVYELTKTGRRKKVGYIYYNGRYVTKREHDEFMAPFK